MGSNFSELGVRGEYRAGISAICDSKNSDQRWNLRVNLQVLRVVFVD